ncbi:hypothetical protein QJS04_geneDACA016082 [Acorus gramineus]|uniref:Uncharacterized protein n=1 Tax=Acorus gramineus TaxID=55184 RepID=A0AAV9BHS4_ACOGR|nr:hypothetical protein QJS04_geneDACA016082 [Acorus gramineus]
MDPPKGFLGYVWNFIVFCPVFVLLFLLGLIKVIIFGPVVFIIVTVGLSGVIIALWPMHVAWTLYCIAKTKKYGVMLKIVTLFGLLVPLLVWPVFGLIGSVLAGLGYGVISPLMATFEAVEEGVENKFKKCFVDGTWSSVLGGCTIVRDFSDVCFHSYFSFMDGLLEWKSESPIEIRLSQIPGCALAAMLGLMIDVPAITFLVAYKAPIMLLKGWQRLVHDLIGRRGPFLETVCVPFAGISILLWPLVVALASFVGILSSVFLGLYAAVVAYQENSTKYGLTYIISVISMFDEYTNDLIYLREGSCFPRLRYRKVDQSTTTLFPVKQLLDQSVTGHAKRQPTKTASMKIQELKAVMVRYSLMTSLPHHVFCLSNNDLECMRTRYGRIFSRHVRPLGKH